ncbi:MAG: methyltransferase [Hyphomicrobiaceae bacterium]|nr:methyltransferase [Hyphomicrobiaceae bacterium]
MAPLLFTIGSVVAAVLLALLLLTLRVPSHRIWPTPGAGTWQSYVFWPLFRGLNVLCFAVAFFDSGTHLGLPAAIRILAALVLAGALALFLRSFFKLGRDNSYGATDGLVTNGIYRWTRNPQNAMLVVVYASLALLADSPSTYVLCAAMMAVYVLMVMVEEPWLESVYGEPYRLYCRRVPRFFNWRRASVLWRALGRQWSRRKGMASRTRPA